jgi:hypothetical protein
MNFMSQKWLNLVTNSSDKSIGKLKGDSMPSNKVTAFFTSCFCVMFWSFLAVHHAHMKTPGQGRDIASSKVTVKPWYDASYKL